MRYKVPERSSAPLLLHEVVDRGRGHPADSSRAELDVLPIRPHGIECAAYLEHHDVAYTRKDHGFRARWDRLNH
jgi:hypothetical protein